jgi:glyoxalase family protein
MRRISLHGLHHIAVATADAARATVLYGEVLGLRPLETSLAYGGDDVVAAAFADQLGRPGSIVQLLERPAARAGRAGVGCAHEVLWRVASHESLRFWQERLHGFGLEPRASAGGPDALPGLAVADGEGLLHRLVIDASGDEPLAGANAAIPAEHALRGIEGIRATAREWVASADLLAGRLDFRVAGRGELALRGRRAATYGYATIDRRARAGREGPGLVDHVAWIGDGRDLRIWRERVIGLGWRVSRMRDHDGFQAFSFREPAGVRFEIASAPAISRVDGSEPSTEEVRLLAA